MRRIQWADRQMPVLAAIRERFEREQPLAGYRISACLHVTTETANLMRTLKAGGADVVLCASNPLSTQDDVAAALVDEYDIAVFAIKGEDNDTYYAHIEAAVDHKPHLTMDDGADVIGVLHSHRREQLGDIIAGTEETTTGVIRLKAMEADGALAFPVIAVNDAKTKHLFDNRYGTGQSTIDGIIRATNVLLAGKRFVVARLRLGRPRRGAAGPRHGRARDRHRGRPDAGARGARWTASRCCRWRTRPKIGDIFCTATGDKHVIAREHIERDEGRRDPREHGPLQRRDRHPGASLARDGDARGAAVRRGVHDGRRAADLPARRRPAREHLGRRGPSGDRDGHVLREPGAGRRVRDRSTRARSSGRCTPVPQEIDSEIARLKLATMGIDIDQLTEEQAKYLASWDEGTNDVGDPGSPRTPSFGDRRGCVTPRPALLRRSR